ncbi:hypothetical protein K469DRAFT_89477 [Zopfia rhizophila CBS 207.26]|uniref:F-box domain-containing protein n=1 Tax=Zopfia rhizophila CBS 207.26 TaxID=1314779 RepID=A0A6A6E862_9PEZI|nr:hypothetical protein K469DRAFT_89477 [Zopfia rhizophila CBS 207.26]
MEDQYALVEYIKPTDGPTNAATLVETLKTRPELAEHVKNLIVKRSDTRFVQRFPLSMGAFEDIGDYISALEIPFVIEDDNATDYSKEAREIIQKQHYERISMRPTQPIRSSRFDTAYFLFHVLLSILPNIKVLDMSQYNTDTLGTSWADMMPSSQNCPCRSLDPFPHKFPHLKELVVTLHRSVIDELWPIFRLSSLETLHIRHTHFSSGSRYLDKWLEASNTSHLKHLTFTGMLFQLSDVTTQLWLVS